MSPNLRPLVVEKLCQMGKLCRDTWKSKEKETSVVLTRVRIQMQDCKIVSSIVGIAEKMMGAWLTTLHHVTPCRDATSRAAIHLFHPACASRFSCNTSEYLLPVSVFEALALKWRKFFFLAQIQVQDTFKTTKKRRTKHSCTHWKSNTASIQPNRELTCKQRRRPTVIPHSSITCLSSSHQFESRLPPTQSF